MRQALSRFAPSPSLDLLRKSGGGRPQRGGAAVARGRWPWAARISNLRGCKRTMQSNHYV